MIDTFVPPRIRRLFTHLVSGQYDNFDIVPCTVLGEDSFAIVVVDETTDGYAMMPIFVLATPVLRVQQRGGGEGGPSRQFQNAHAEVARPVPH
jgi:hypothetical protein